MKWEYKHTGNYEHIKLYERGLSLADIIIAKRTREGRINASTVSTFVSTDIFSIKAFYAAVDQGPGLKEKDREDLSVIVRKMVLNGTADTLAGERTWLLYDPERLMN